jgi:hypothetical protein
MTMLLLSLFWLLVGLLIGTLVIAAKLPLLAWFHDKGLILLGIAGLAALVGGWLGTLVLGSLFGTATAVWVAVLVVVVPGLIRFFKSHRSSNK